MTLRISGRQKLLAKYIQMNTTIVFDQQLCEKNHFGDDEKISICVKLCINLELLQGLSKAANLFVSLLLNGTSALFSPLVPRIAEVEHMRHVKSDL